MHPCSFSHLQAGFVDYISVCIPDWSWDYISEWAFLIKNHFKLSSYSYYEYVAHTKSTVHSSCRVGERHRVIADSVFKHHTCVLTPAQSLQHVTRCKRTHLSWNKLQIRDSHPCLAQVACRVCGAFSQLTRFEAKCWGIKNLHTERLSYAASCMSCSTCTVIYAKYFGESKCNCS